MLLPPRVVWKNTDETHRLVMLESPDQSQPNEFFLEFKNGASDAMGTEHWVPCAITDNLFSEIMQAVKWPAPKPKPEQ